MSGAKLLLGLFVFNLGAFGLFGWALERWGADATDWGRIVGAALVMGIAVTDLSARLGKVDPDEVRPRLGAWSPALRITFWFWAALLGAVGLSAALVWRFA